MGKLLAFALLLLLLILSGTFFLKQSSNLSPDNEQTSFKTELNNAGAYNIARTSNGGLTKTVKLDLGPINNHEITREFSKKEAHKLKLNQKIILKDKSNTLIDSHGTITALNSKEKNVDVTVTIPDNIKLENLSNELNVIIFQSRVSHRLPYSTVQFDNDDRAFVWVAETQPNNTTTFKARRKVLGEIYEGDNFFDPNIPKKAYMLFVLNPDTALKEGKEYSFEKTKITAPLHSPLDQAKFEKHLKELEKTNAIMSARRAACKQALEEKDTFKISKACGRSNKQKPMDLINDIIKNRKN